MQCSLVCQLFNEGKLTAAKLLLLKEKYSELHESLKTSVSPVKLCTSLLCLLINAAGESKPLLLICTRLYFCHTSKSLQQNFVI